MEIIPRIYQGVAVKAAIKALRSGLRRALIVLATGLGKTLTAAFVAKEMHAKRVLFLVHNNFILSHALSEFRLIFYEKIKMVIYNGHTKKGAAEAQIVFATWQTMGNHLNEWNRDHFDLVIVDEAHHTEAETFRPVVDYFIGAKLGITATPDRQDNTDIRDVFGPEVANITLEEAIARGWLPRIEYHVVTDESLDDKALQKIVAEIRDSKKRFTMAEVNRRVFIKKRDVEVAKIINGYNEKALVFCASISHAERMNKSLELSAAFHSENGKTQKDAWRRNQKALEALRNGTIRRVCAVDAFNEGVNVPSIGLVAFCRATGVITIFRQQLGRGLRPGKDKLIVLDFVGNLERIQLVTELMNRISDLHEKFTPKGEMGREGYTRQRFEVSGQGFEFTFSDKVVDLMKVLEHCERDFYPTWQEASRAALKLGVTTFAQYREKYRLDEKLPAYPHEVYKDFPGFYTFFDKSGGDYYPTWQEASRVVQKMGVKTLSEYRKKRKQDSRLPKALYGTYRDFPGTDKFFGLEPKSLYPTWKQASKAARKLAIQSQTDYKDKYKKDPRLPSAPRVRKYAGFPGWSNFLGVTIDVVENPYPTWQEAQKAVKKLGITSFDEYKKNRRKDKRLPSTPHNYEGFPGFRAFFLRRYLTWQEASRAAMKLGIKSRREHVVLCKKDPLIPAFPQVYYKDFPGWEKFLGK